MTRRSKSSSPSPPAGWLPWNAAGRSPKDIKSALLSFAATLLLLDKSCSFLECSCSTFEPSDLMSSMNCWNCLRSRSGPSAIFHNNGIISMAVKSASASFPTWRRTFRAASMTAGSLVLMALSRGIIFSCMVYLSRTLTTDLVFFCGAKPLNPSSGGVIVPSPVPPQRVTNASNPRTFMPRLDVLLKTEAITGNNSFFMVLKSRTGRMTGKLRSAASTIEWVGDSMASWIIGRISAVVSMMNWQGKK